MFASGPSRQSIRRSKSVGNGTARKIRQRQRNGGQATSSRQSKQKQYTQQQSSDDEDDATLSDNGSEKVEVFKPRKRGSVDKKATNNNNNNNVNNSFNNNAFEEDTNDTVNVKNGKNGGNSILNERVEVATEVEETTTTIDSSDYTTQIIAKNQTINTIKKLVVEQDESLSPQQNQHRHKHKHHRNKYEGGDNVSKTWSKNGAVVTVPVIETIFTDPENNYVAKSALLNGHDGHHHLSPVLNGSIAKQTQSTTTAGNRKSFKTICSPPPVVRKISGNGAVPTEHGMSLSVETDESPDMHRMRKYSNNHLYVPGAGDM